MRQRLAQQAHLVEHIGDGGGVDAREAARQIVGSSRGMNRILRQEQAGQARGGT